MFRAAAVYAYGIGCLLAIWFAFAGTSAVVTVKSRGGEVGVLEAIGFSFIPMLVLTLLAFLAQRRSKALVLPLAIFVAGAAAALAPALVTHWAPGIGDPLGVAHLVIVAVGLFWSFRILRGTYPQ